MLFFGGIQKEADAFKHDEEDTIAAAGLASGRASKSRIWGSRTNHRRKNGISKTGSADGRNTHRRVYSVYARSGALGEVLHFARRDSVGKCGESAEGGRGGGDIGFRHVRTWRISLEAVDCEGGSATYVISKVAPISPTSECDASYGRCHLRRNPFVQKLPYNIDAVEINPATQLPIGCETDNRSFPTGKRQRGGRSRKNRRPANHVIPTA